MDRTKTESLNDTSSLSYLKYLDKKEDVSDQGSSILKKKKCPKAMAIRALLASAKKPSAVSSIGYRSKTDWGSEEDTASRPYALDLPGPSQQVCEEDEDVIIDPIQDQNSEIDGKMSAASKNYDERNLDQELNHFIEATKGKLKVAVSKPSSSSTRRAVSGRPVFHQQTYFSAAEEKISKQMAITGQKYHNSDFSLSQDNRPSSAFRCNSTSLPKISNQVQKTFHSDQVQKNESINHNNIVIEKKDSGIEIPKWYHDSGTKPTHDQNLIRFMEIMGSKSSLRSPRKLSSSGFYSVPMPNQPPEARGFVFEKKPRGLYSVLNEIMLEEHELKVDVLKVPTIYNQRSFAQEVESNREAKLNRKIKH
jgi:hypothetical protein